MTGSIDEAPPYTLGQAGNNTLGVPNFTLGTPNIPALTPAFTLGTPSGTVMTPSGTQSYAGNGDEFFFKYGVLPTLTFDVNPSFGGSISFNGTRYAGSGSGSYGYGSYTAFANVSAGYRFSSWSVTGGLSLNSTSSNPATVTIKGTGTLTANVTQAKATFTPTASTLLATLAGTTLLITKRARRARVL